MPFELKSERELPFDYRDFYLLVVPLYVLAKLDNDFFCYCCMLESITIEDEQLLVCFELKAETFNAVCGKRSIKCEGFAGL